MMAAAHKQATDKNLVELPEYIVSEIIHDQLIACPSSLKF